jgi:hypothetical protein
MQRLITEPVLALDLRQRGLERSRQFTWERAARQTSAVYHQVIAARGRRVHREGEGPE